MARVVGENKGAEARGEKNDEVGGLEDGVG